MFRVIGITGLVVSCGLIGMQQKQKLIRRIELLEDFYQMILNLKSNINYFKEPLTNIFAKSTKNANSKAYMLLKAVYDDLFDKHREIRKIWAEKASLTYNKCPVTPKDLEIMTYMGDFIGQTDYVNQLQHFEYLEANLNIQINQAKEELNSKGPMYNKIGYFIGAIIGIILI